MVRLRAAGNKANWHGFGSCSVRNGSERGFRRVTGSSDVKYNAHATYVSVRDDTRLLKAPQTNNQ